MNDLIDLLQRQQLVWHGDEQIGNIERVSSGNDELDEALQGGLPKYGVVDIQAQQGIGELRLLLPYLVQQRKLTIFINPPGYINGHGLFHLGFETALLLSLSVDNEIDALWAAEQCLKSAECSSVLLWQNRLAIHHIKRLQLAAERGQASLFLMRSAEGVNLSLPVSLCLKLQAHERGLAITIKKQKGRWDKTHFILDISSYWPALYRPTIERKVVSLAQHRRRLIT
ncbi:translesion DNA synthesis-associated protein ImuA [Pseudoalteromonas aurantia]|uniref:Translesion DNA synthesis-associated protein ImuA n=1 Tax=Pseudoalteromonas aurantia 208 TaxID=1314867 RepID=A0ABR9EBJ6_9GAMM|nr:translesion DNA synthesis-associated protein ImuA [Pseudoalteromonas aurantia]MBE0368370.1 hypothetical protein [Pseudoalteromonas aurantia 208]